MIDIRNRTTQIVGTDTRRLAIVIIENISQTKLSLVVPKKAILEIQKLFANEIDIYYDNTNLVIENRNYLLFSRLINGKFPDYERIIPKRARYAVKLSKKRFSEND